ncbi:MAG: ABC transporter permease [Caulobacter sp.]|nr:ABC transporter permease [Caulobacter sp.]
MFADAFAAERLRLLRARGVLFWGFLFVPLFGVAAGLINGLFMRFLLQRAGGQALARAPVDLAGQAIDAINGANFFVVQLFFMIAAASILAGDYRWETWRLLTPRNTRANLILAKLAAFGAAAAVGLLLLALGGVVAGLIGAALTNAPVELTRAGLLPVLRQLAGGFAVSWLEMMALAGVAACLAVLTRAGLAAMLVPIAVWIAQAFIVSQARGRFADPNDPPLVWLAALPALCADTLRAAVASAAAPLPAPPHGALAALLFLVLWVAGLAALAVVLFQRQDLTRE